MDERVIGSHQQAMQQLGCDDLHELVDRKFLQEFGLELPGQPKEVYAELALGYTNAQEIELLGPGQNTTFYSDKIPADGSIGLHHACIFQDNIFEKERRLNDAGYPTAGSGHIGVTGIYTTRIRYIDTREIFGFYIELVEYKMLGMHSPPGEKIITFLAKLQKRFGKS